MREASEYLDSIGHPYVYWYSERATLGHESRRVLAARIAGGEERSAPGATPTRAGLALTPAANASFPPTRQPDGAVFVFFGSFNLLLDQVAAKYPPVEGLPAPVISEFYSDQYRSYDYRAFYLPNELLAYYAQKEGASYIVRPTP